MTMLAHTMKHILQLVPEALPLVKQASVDQEMPLDNKDSVLATALQMAYFEKVAYSPVDVFKLEKVAEAVEAYGLKDQIKSMTETMVKSAAYHNHRINEVSDESFMLKVASFEMDMPSMSIIDKSEMAAKLYKEAQERGIEPNETLVMYSGNGYFSKEAAVKALSVRFDATKNQDFVKIAEAIAAAPMTPEMVRNVADTIDGMDKAAGLHFKGHNFHREAIFTKEAAFKGSITVNLNGKDVPYESIERVGKDNIAQYIGADIAKEMDGGPMNFKAVLETLPKDLQRVLASLIKNV